MVSAVRGCRSGHRRGCSVRIVVKVSFTFAEETNK
jgi:hypothetical protein